MKTFKINALILFILFLTGCGKDDAQVQSLNGAYTGQFTLTNNDPAADTKPIMADVTVTFSGDRYHCTNIIEDDSGGRGKYTITKNEIYFTDSTIHKAVYDGSFVLAGQYTFSKKKDNLVISKKNGYRSFTYMLKKQ